MKLRVFLSASLLFMGVLGASAQKGIDNGTPFGSGEDSIRCITANSLYYPYAKSGNYADALEPWTTAFTECPASNKNLYLYGVQIVDWQIANATDAAQKEELINKLMFVYDQRIKYFGNDARYGADWILSRKAQSYVQHKGENVDPKLLRDWLVVALDQYGEKTEPMAVSYFMFASHRLLIQDPEANKAQYIEDYLRSTAIFDAQLVAANAANNEKDIKTLTTYKTGIDAGFAGSGAADCETLQNMYAEKVEENKENMEYLQETLALLKRVRCTDTDVYIAASRYMHVNNPTAESAVGLAKQAVRDNDFELAIKYFEEAASLDEDPASKADDYYMIAVIMTNQNNYSRARQYANKALEQVPSYGKAYILIGQMYAATAKSVYPNDAVLAKVVYNTAIDKFERARQVDSEVAGEANSLINTYRAHLPSTEDVFMHPDIEKGKQFKVGGWINETTTIR
ncbi:tetratricopeptide (TPR) repeat protein [Parabacteroides sp. PFB2-12]|uniref:tetratricopeptide repeat protein n=1 Tax=unclassified Parabacteroides TaxID=2649774 RepID=UPI0024742BF1|nr:MULTISPECIES: hypothetical protein [unclassified Parabacteroides]MDH6341303.1 tetratricopeptide (TPR) repeat protein [Parabacteroides sp. PM6-13]MDH6389095.1 tetratricopeptide (TPR) repeat protein [Parabacteroides sp. PFB2-12]